MVVIGILALQGDFAEHRQKIVALGAKTIDIRQAKDLQAPLDGMILPGGESTVQGKLLRDLGMLEPLKSKIDAGLPVLASEGCPQFYSRHRSFSFWNFFAVCSS